MRLLAHDWMGTKAEGTPYWQVPAHSSALWGLCHASSSGDVSCLVMRGKCSAVSQALLQGLAAKPPQRCEVASQRACGGSLRSVS
eukprot:4028757-Amphidinium_carterae.1